MYSSFLHRFVATPHWLGRPVSVCSSRCHANTSQHTLAQRATTTSRTAHVRLKRLPEEIFRLLRPFRRTTKDLKDGVSLAKRLLQEMSA